MTFISLYGHYTGIDTGTITVLKLRNDFAKK